MQTTAIVIVFFQSFILAVAQMNPQLSFRPVLIESPSITIIEDERPSETQTLVQSDLKAKLDTYLKTTASEKGFSGAVLIAKGKKVLLSKGYGWADKQKTSPVKRNTKFYIASISKQFTAAAILKLQEQGKLNVQDSIGKYLKNIPVDKKETTIHQLLTHTAGLRQMYAADGIVDRDEAVRLLLQEPLKDKPGEKFGYSNDAYNLLAIIVEVVSGQTFESFLRQQLLTPTKMSQTGFWGERLATGEEPIASLLQDIPEQNKRPNWGFRGAIGIFSTVEDLYKWQQALFANKVLARSTKEKLLAPYAQTSRGMYTYGWFITEKDKIGREIWTAGTEGFGHNAIIKTYPDETVIIVASNAGEISGILARDLVGKELERVIFSSTVKNGENVSKD